jgi:CheY-like chemotaxis protein
MPGGGERSSDPLALGDEGARRSDVKRFPRVVAALSLAGHAFRIFDERPFGRNLFADIWLAGSPPIAHHWSDMRVVVIEDHVDTADLMREILLEAGHDVHVAHSGHEGIAAACEATAEVVLCDVGLPDIDGYEVARRLRADARTATARLVALTGYDGDDEERKAHDAGFDRHVVKPIDPFQLESLIKP